jgi:serine/threonine protein kinase
MLFTELMQGGSVKDLLLRYSNLPEQRALRYFIQAAQGLSFLHSWKPNPIVHRDVKCELIVSF